jgi:hypothetical protein
MRILSTIVLVTFSTSCAHDVTAVYSASPPMGGGAIEVALNDSTSALSITVNDVLVVDRERSRKAHIDGVPIGLARVRVATGGRCEQAREYDREVEVIPGQTAHLILPGPEGSVGCMVYYGLVYVGMNIGLAAIALIGMTAQSQPMTHVK